jgi:hypothetical protein
VGFSCESAARLRGQIAKNWFNKLVVGWDHSVLAKVVKGCWETGFALTLSYSIRITFGRLYLNPIRCNAAAQIPIDVGRSVLPACFVCAARRCLDAGGCPAAGYFILLVQNTSNQTKRHPAAPALRASLGFPGESGGRVKLGLRPQTNAADCPRFTRKTEAVQRGIWVLWAEPVFWVSSPPGRAGWGGSVFVLSVPLVHRRAAQPGRGKSARTV